MDFEAQLKKNDKSSCDQRIFQNDPNHDCRRQLCRCFSNSDHYNGRVLETHVPIVYSMVKETYYYSSFLRIFLLFLIKIGGG